MAVVAVAAAFAAAAYVLQRPTVARGDVMAADLLAINSKCRWRALTCQPEIPIDRRGARFTCAIELDDRREVPVVFTIDDRGASRLELVAGGRVTPDELCR